MAERAAPLCRIRRMRNIINQVKRRYAGEKRMAARSWIALEVGDCRFNYLGIVLFRVHVLGGSSGLGGIQRANARPLYAERASKKGRDSNPRDGFPSIRIAGGCLQPLGHPAIKMAVYLRLRKNFQGPAGSPRWRPLPRSIFLGQLDGEDSRRLGRVGGVFGAEFASGVVSVDLPKQLAALVGEAAEIVLAVGVVVRGGGSTRSHHAIMRNDMRLTHALPVPGAPGEATFPPPVKGNYPPVKRNYPPVTFLLSPLLFSRYLHVEFAKACRNPWSFPV